MTSNTQLGKLKTRRDFLRIQRGGLRSKGQFVSLISRNSHSESHTGRFGLVTPKSIGKAHDRNKIKRRLRHILSLFPEIVADRDVVLLASVRCRNATFEELKSDLLQAVQQHNKIERSRKRYLNYHKAKPKAFG